VKSYAMVRLILSGLFVVCVLMLLFSPEWLLFLSPHIADTRHLLIAGTGILLYIGNQAAMRWWEPDPATYHFDESIQNNCPCHC